MKKINSRTTGHPLDEPFKDDTILVQGAVFNDDIMKAMVHDDGPMGVALEAISPWGRMLGMSEKDKLTFFAHITKDVSKLASTLALLYVMGMRRHYAMLEIRAIEAEEQKRLAPPGRQA